MKLVVWSCHTSNSAGERISSSQVYFLPYWWATGQSCLQRATSPSFPPRRWTRNTNYLVGRRFDQGFRLRDHAGPVPVSSLLKSAKSIMQYAPVDVNIADISSLRDFQGWRGMTWLGWWHWHGNGAVRGTACYLVSRRYFFLALQR